MPVPHEGQVAALRDLYARTHRGGPGFDTWTAQIERQGQWERTTVSHIIAFLQVRSAQMPTGEWVDGHHLIDGTVWHVHPPRNVRRSQMYPEAREVHSLDLNNRTRTGRASWRFRARATTQSAQENRSRVYRIPAFSIQTLMTPETIVAYGSTHGFCGICGRTLTVAESVERGVGPVCWRRVVEYRDRIAAVTAAAERAIVTLDGDGHIEITDPLNGLAAAVEENAAAGRAASAALNEWAAAMRVQDQANPRPS